MLAAPAARFNGREKCFSRPLFLPIHSYDPEEKMGCRIVGSMNQKGGVGKTTTAINLGAAIAEAGKRVLLIDLDPQAHLTRGLGIDPVDLERSMYDVMTDPRGQLDPVIIPTKWRGLDIAPSHIDLSGAEVEMVPMFGREARLARALGDVPSRYDFIIIDCQPSLSLLTINAMNCSTEIFIMMQAHPFALEGLDKLYEVYELVSEQMNPDLLFSGVLVTMFDTRTKVSHEVVRKLKADPRTSHVLFETIVRTNIKIAESQGAGMPVIHYDVECHGAYAYRALAQEVMSLDLEAIRRRDNEVRAGLSQEGREAVLGGEPEGFKAEDNSPQTDIRTAETQPIATDGVADALRKHTDAA